MTNQQSDCAPSEDSDRLSGSLLCAQWLAEDSSFLHAESKTPIRLCGCVFAGRTAILLVLSCDSINVLNQDYP